MTAVKVLHVSTYDNKGGAARAAFRLHKELINQDIKSEMLVQKKFSDEPEIRTPYLSELGKLYARARPHANKLVQKFQLTDNLSLHSSNFLPSGLHRRINKSDVDLIHIHWINKEMISIREISKITKPIVWTLHDMWAFCGAEHIDSIQFPGRYKEGYHTSNRPVSHKGLDIDRWTWKRKKRYWTNLNVQLVTPGSWLVECVQNSKLFASHKVALIHNGLDINLFKPINKPEARKILNLPQDRKIITFGALDLNTDPNKGYSYLKKAFRDYVVSGIKKEDLYISIFGSSKGKHGKIEGICTRYFGMVKDDNLLSIIYSAADVMVVPSLIEAFGQTASEALSCGTPVVAFKSSGLIDLINHKKNGYLANPYEPKDLANGITWIINDDNRIKKLSQKAREIAEEKFDIKEITKKHINMYKKVIKNHTYDNFKKK